MRLRKFFIKNSLCVLFVLLLLLFSMSPALAQKSTQTVKDITLRQAERDIKEKSKEVKILLDKIEILGKIDKPQTLFILPGQDPTVDDIRIDRSFFKEIFRPIEKDNIVKIVRRNKTKKDYW